MTIQNSLKILSDISKIEKNISTVEEQAKSQGLEIDYHSLLNIILKGITDK
tara:strand:- start:15 stop:167 length:153 start_codon:yes stop_codon:yes gene_type:complete